MNTVTGLTRRMRFPTTATRLRMPLLYAIAVAVVALGVLTLHEQLQFGVQAWLSNHVFPFHRVHHVMIGTLVAVLLTGIGLQLYRPAQRVGAYLFAAIALGSLLVATALAADLGALLEVAIFAMLVAIIGLLHPGLRSFRPTRTRMDLPMAALALLALVPLTAFAAVQMDLQLTAVDAHVGFGHYTFMAAGAVTIGLGALLASFRPVGWRFLAYGVALLAILVGLASIAFTDPVQGTNFDVTGGVLAIMWAVWFVAVAEYRDYGYPSPA